jgi:hypothetical protein
MPRNDAATPGQVCPGIRIHAIDIVQPPGIGIPPMVDMEAHHAIVTAALAANSSAETPKKARSDAEDISREISCFPVINIGLFQVDVAAPDRGSFVPDAEIVARRGRGR